MGWSTEEIAQATADLFDVKKGYRLTVIEKICEVVFYHSIASSSRAQFHWARAEADNPAYWHDGKPLLQKITRKDIDMTSAPID